MKERLENIQKTLFKEGNFTKEDIPAFLSGWLWGFLTCLILWCIYVHV